MLPHLQPLIQASVKRSYSSGSTIFYQGEVPRSAGILVSGVVRVFSISALGDEQTVTYHLPGEFFPSSWIFNKTPGALFFYDAVDDCEVAYVDRDELISFIMAEPARTRATLDYFTTDYSATLIRINGLGQPRARDKLLYTLYYLCERYGTQHDKNMHIPMTLTHQNLASLVGLTRETTATEMNKLKKQSVLTYGNQHYVIAIEKLLDLIGEDSFRGIKIKV